MRSGPVAAVVLGAVVACDGTATRIAASPATMTLTMTSSQVEVARGQVELVVANVALGEGPTGEVNLVIDGVPSGMRAEASGFQTGNGMTSGLVAIFVDPTVEIGTYDLTVRAIAFGSPDAATHLAVVVNPSGTPGYTLETRPIPVGRGSSVTVLANIDRGTNTRDLPVTMSAEHVPDGVTVTLYPLTNPKALTNMTVTVGPGVSAGRYSVTIRGAAPGLIDRLATIPLLVLAN